MRGGYLRAAVRFVVAFVVLAGLVVGRVAAFRGPAPDSSRTFTSEDYAELATDPDAFRGSSVDIKGQMFAGVEVQDGVTTFQMYADPEDLDWNTVVHSMEEFRHLDDGDWVRVRGTVLGELEGENAFGATVAAVEVEAESVDLAFPD